MLLSACKEPSAGAGKDTSKTTELKILTWSEYFQDEQIQAFENARHVKVIRDYFSSNEELLSKIQASVKSGSTGYDLIIPSDYMVSSMVELKLLKTIDSTKLSVLKDFDPPFLHPSYDSELKYAVPFCWGTTGIAINKTLVPEFNDSSTISWKELFENPKYLGKVSMLNDSKEVLHAALLAMGKTWDAAGENDIKEAFEYLKKNRKNIRIFSEESKPVLENDECHLCQVYSGDAMIVARNKANIVYRIPQEGATLWTDNFSIPLNAQHETLAHEFINHMLSPEGALAFTTKTFYPTANLPSRKGIPETLLSNKNIYPDVETRKKLVYLKNKTELLPLIDRLWTELKSK